MIDVVWSDVIIKFLFLCHISVLLSSFFMDLYGAQLGKN